MKCLTEDYFVNLTRSALVSCLSREPPPGYCPQTLDGLKVCWPETPNRTLVKLPCPKLPQALFSPYRFATKYCTSNATWWRFSEYHSPWTNYTQCVDHELIKIHARVYKLDAVCYCLSFIFLIISLVIFSMFRSLRCTRISIHKHLFLSQMCSAALSLAQNTLMAYGGGMLMENNPFWCRFIVALQHYFIITNYSWMFCEGFYLHTVLAVVFMDESKLLVPCYIIGWVFPLIPTIIYVTLRATCLVIDPSLQYGRCWLTQVQKFTYLSMAVNALFLVVNLVFLANIVRVVRAKLKSQQGIGRRESEAQILKGCLKALSVLAPVLGVQFVCTGVYRPDINRATQELGTHLYMYIYALINSLQGCMVALVLCFFNGEIQTVLKRAFLKWKTRISNGSIDFMSETWANTPLFNKHRKSSMGSSLKSTTTSTASRRCKLPRGSTIQEDIPFLPQNGNVEHVEISVHDSDVVV